jgi:hypothetical protein
MRRIGSVFAWRLALPSLTAACLAATPAPVAAAPACDRACLLGFVDGYLAALLAHDPSALPVAPNVAFTENGTTLRLGDGLWRGVTGVVARREAFADPTTGQAAFWGVLDEGGLPVLLSLRLKIEDQRIAEIETVVSRKGSHALFAPEAFATPTPAFEQVLAPDQRTSRAALVAAANGYFEGLEQHDRRLVASAVDCDRYENGVLMTNRPGAPRTPRACAAAVDRLTQIRRVLNRRFFVVDEERGVVVTMVLFDIPADAAATPPREARMLLLSELFKVTRGEIERIDTVMHNLPYGSESGWAAP